MINNRLDPLMTYDSSHFSIQHIGFCPLHETYLLYVTFW